MADAAAGAGLFADHILERTLLGVAQHDLASFGGIAFAEHDVVGAWRQRQRERGPAAHVAIDADLDTDWLTLYLDRGVRRAASAQSNDRGGREHDDAERGSHPIGGTAAGGRPAARSDSDLKPSIASGTVACRAINPCVLSAPWCINPTLSLRGRSDATARDMPVRDAKYRVFLHAWLSKVCIGQTFVSEKDTIATPGGQTSGHRPGALRVWGSPACTKLGPRAERRSAPVQRRPGPAV